MPRVRFKMRLPIPWEKVTVYGDYKGKLAREHAAYTVKCLERMGFKVARFKTTD